MIALVQSSNTLPIMALSMLGGVLADDFNHRRIMIIAQCFLAIVVCTCCCGLGRCADALNPLWLHVTSWSGRRA